MTDPLSLVALGAAVGGLAGKVAEKSWEAAEGWLEERFGSHAADAQEQARRNAADFIQQLAHRIKQLEDQGALNGHTVDATSRHPSFTALLQGTVLGAALSDEASKHDLLARLVAARLASETESTFALASQLAADSISRATQRQLCLLALVCFLDEVRPRWIDTAEEYLRWLDMSLAPFDTFEFEEIDARHLVAISCATYDSASNRSLELLLQLKGGERSFKASVSRLARFEVLDHYWVQGLAGVRLTSVGSIVGGLALDSLMGRDSSMPAWSKS